MASNFTGNPTAIEAPASDPALGQPPVLSLIADADGNTAANLYQAWKVLADYCAYDRRQLNAFRYVENNLWGPTSSITSQQNPITGYAPMSAMMSGTGISLSTIVPPAAGLKYFGKLLSTNAGTAINGYSFYSSTAPPFQWASTSSTTSWLRIDTAVGFAAASNINFFIGTSSVQNFNTGAAPANSVGFGLANGATQWVAYNQGSTSTISATYNPLTGANVNAMQLMRIEWFGSGTQEGINNGGTAFAKFWLSTPGSTTLVNVASINGTPSTNQYFIEGCWQPANVTSISPYLGEFQFYWSPM